MRYIGGYIVRKFSKTYPHLGRKADCLDQKKDNWIAAVNRGDLFEPTDEFFSELLIMREVFNAIHSKALLHGKHCVKNLYSELKQSGVSVPDEVINFFARISIFFRLRYLNDKIRFNKENDKTSNEKSRKKRKIMTRLNDVFRHRNIYDYHGCNRTVSKIKCNIKTILVLFITKHII